MMHLVLEHLFFGVCWEVVKHGILIAVKWLSAKKRKG